MSHIEAGIYSITRGPSVYRKDNLVSNSSSHSAFPFPRHIGAEGATVCLTSSVQDWQIIFEAGYYTLKHGPTGQYAGYDESTPDQIFLVQSPQKWKILNIEDGSTIRKYIATFDEDYLLTDTDFAPDSFAANQVSGITHPLYLRRIKEVEWYTTWDLEKKLV